MFGNEGQDLHQKGCTFVKICTLTHNQTIPAQLTVIRCHLRFLEPICVSPGVEVREIGIPLYLTPQNTSA